MKKIVWEELYRQQAPLLLGVCRRYVKDIHRAEDLMHDAFMTAIRKQESFSNTGAVEAWLRKITVTTVLMHLRQEKKFSLLLQNEQIDIPAPASDEPDDTPQNVILSAGFEQSDLLEALDLLPEHHRVVFNLYVFEDYSHKQIGDELGISPGTSKSHLARARKKIQEILLRKAQEMSKKKKRAAILLFPFQKEQGAYIDQLLKDNLKDQVIQPGPMPEKLSAALKQARALPLKKSIKWQKPLWLGGTLTILALLVLWFAQPPESSQASPVMAEPMLSNVPKEIVPSDSTHRSQPLQQDDNQAGFQKTILENSRAPLRKLSSQKPPPVIINKQLVVKDTVFQIIE